MGKSSDKDEVVLRGWVRVRPLRGLVGEGDVRSDCGEGRAETAAPARRKISKRRIVCSERIWVP